MIHAEQSAVVLLHNPFQPSQREVMVAHPSQTIRQWLGNQGIAEFDQPTVCIKNGTPVLRADWAVTPIDGVVLFITLPQGGGGGGGGKNPLRTVLMIAVMVVATVYGGPLGASLGFSGNLATAVGSAIIMTAGSALVSALVPLPTPNMPSFAGAGGSLAQPSPTYSLQGQGNYARLAQPIPVIYGRHLVYPDLAATPYGEYQSNEQYLHQLHCIGLGEYDIEQIRIEDTPIASFEEVIYQIVPPGSAVTLFNPDVVTAPEVAGQELVAGIWTGGFAINPADSEVTHIGIDILLPRGLYFANDAGGLDSRSASWKVEARAIDAEGEPLNDWFTLGSESLTAATTTPQRRTYLYPVAAGRYEVRATRLDGKDGNSRAGHEVRWGEARGYLAGGVTFSDNVTLLAIRMRATDNLSQRSSRLINCIVTRKLPVWSVDSGWSALLPTRSIAWAFADILRASYGAKLPDARIDLAALAQLDQVWADRGDQFDGVFDQQVTVWEALTRVARCGRAVPFLQGGIMRLARDEARLLPVALFSPRNIVKNSLKIQYVMPGEETADAVTVEFFSSRTWKPDEVTVSLPGSSSANPAKLRLFGCTTEAHAMREGLYLAAANRYRRRIVTLRTELEGLIPTYGDLIAIAHDMPSWGTGGEIVAWDADTHTATLSEPVQFTDGQPHIPHTPYVMALRRRDGGVSGPHTVTPGSDAQQVIFAEPPDIPIETGLSAERTHFAFGIAEQWSLLARVIAVRPRGEQVEITCVAEHPAVHTADQI
ncbi:phage tail protein [Cupriavidus pauculus]|uniref:phage tail protein n=1 Tax=Cupriavidus pauculus TaxID=82633 RepID=UPI001BA46CB4|nr:phage tail protein [Cupriavidus pauculus]UAL01309.1 phage tail protein [Cupriavidus pauculus]